MWFENLQGSISKSVEEASRLIGEVNITDSLQVLNLDSLAEEDENKEKEDDDDNDDDDDDDGDDDDNDVDDDGGDFNSSNNDNNNSDYNSTNTYNVNGSNSNSNADDFSRTNNDNGADNDIDDFIYRDNDDIEGLLVVPRTISPKHSSSSSSSSFYDDASTISTSSGIEGPSSIAAQGDDLDQASKPLLASFFDSFGTSEQPAHSPPLQQQQQQNKNYNKISNNSNGSIHSILNEHKSADGIGIDTSYYYSSASRSNVSNIDADDSGDAHATADGSGGVFFHNSSSRRIGSNNSEGGEAEDIGIEPLDSLESICNTDIRLLDNPNRRSTSSNNLSRFDNSNNNNNSNGSSKNISSSNSSSGAKKRSKGKSKNKSDGGKANRQVKKDGKKSLDFFGFGDSFLSPAHGSSSSSSSADADPRSSYGQNGDSNASGFASNATSLSSAHNGAEADEEEGFIDHEGNYYQPSRSNSHNNNNNNSNSDNHADNIHSAGIDMAALAMSVFGLGASPQPSSVGDGISNINSSSNSNSNSSRYGSPIVDDHDRDFFGSIDPKDLDNDPILLRLKYPSPLRNKKLYPDILYDLGIVDIEGKADSGLFGDDPYDDSNINSINGNSSNSSSSNSSGRAGGESSGTSPRGTAGYLGNVDSEMIKKLSDGSQLPLSLRARLRFLQIRNVLVFSWNVLYIVLVNAYNFFALSLGLWDPVNAFSDDSSSSSSSSSTARGGERGLQRSRGGGNNEGNNLLSESNVRDSIRMKIRKQAHVVWQYLSSVNGLSVLTAVLFLYSYFKFRRYGTDNGD